jgi:hypothetical protein
MHYLGLRIVITYLFSCRKYEPETALHLTIGLPPQLSPFLPHRFICAQFLRNGGFGGSLPSRHRPLSGAPRPFPGLSGRSAAGRNGAFPEPSANGRFLRTAVVHGMVLARLPPQLRNRAEQSPDVALPGNEPRTKLTCQHIEPPSSSTRLRSAPRVQDKGRLCRCAAPDGHFRADKRGACRASWRRGHRGKDVTGFSRRPAERYDPREGSRSSRSCLSCVNAGLAADRQISAHNREDRNG